ncbi:potassium transporter [Hyphomicrobium denitrificans ATCC 51888]|uniref:Probable potassium transport system protein Kup n=1 Tax=Hyphomicrobium denitrificans (strain ATCC 51888 / DSM 1869 / NCIMB 11706 / TK 0415) TaxID=582899 RepID=D8JTB2_HYPDA|nr:potassium transporter Kup [Hyphomicrobium denitrificans]ADJ24430.1 potassium transporter [Hyphomicrobium denitrificans ATCC 51888]
MAQPQASLPAVDFGSAEGHDNKNFWALALGSVGVVFGDIGTSPLYAFKEAITAASHHGTVAEATLGVLSLIFWSMTLVVTIKYVLLLLHADNKGEGGMFALMALGQTVARRSAPLLGALGIAGASFFYGDAVITPAISVLSAVEGLRLIAPQLEVAIIPAALVVLTGLFWMQSHGTARVARFFGPVMALWFAVLALGGLMHIADNLSVLLALNPLYGIEFVYSNGVLGLTVMGLVFLACTGAEALYADLGHFGRRPITVSWLYFVMPALILNYFGQGALVMNDANAIENPFYRLYPQYALVPMLILSTFATVIACQAVITGAFSLTRQAIQLGLIPRFEIRHTSESVAGQIYIPRVNWILFIFVVMVIFAFRTSSNLAAAYGVSVTAAMVIDTLMAFFVIWKCWRWPLWRVALVVIPLLMIEQAFFSANLLKLFEGGWVPLVIAAMLAIIMFSWVKGTRLLAKLTKRNEADLDWLVRKLEAKPPHRVPGTAVFLTGDPYAAPTSMMHNLKHNRVMHERNILLSIRTVETPRVARHERITIERVSDHFIRIVARYGFMETPSVPKILEHARRKDCNIDIGATSFFLSRRSLRKTPKSELPRWQERLFIVLAASAEDATTYFQIPTDRVVEVGTQVAI